MIIRGLGLKLVKGSSTYKDIQNSDWYASCIQIANTHNLIMGYEDDCFKPNQNITREEAMVILARAMSYNDYKSQVTGKPGTIDTYKDKSTVSTWALADAELNVKAGTIQGDPMNNLRPKAVILYENILSKINTRGKFYLEARKMITTIPLLSSCFIEIHIISYISPYDGYRIIP